MKARDVGGWVLLCAACVVALLFVAEIGARLLREAGPRAPDLEFQARAEAVAVAWWIALGRTPERVVCSPVPGSGRSLRFVRCSAVFPPDDRWSRRHIEAFDCDPDAGDCEIR